jgi:hypothetical protein
MVVFKENFHYGGLKIVFISNFYYDGLKILKIIFCKILFFNQVDVETKFIL